MGGSPRCRSSSRELMLPAVGQGFWIETRKDDARVRGAIDFLNDAVTGCEVGAERSFLKRLEGDASFRSPPWRRRRGKASRWRGCRSEDGG